MDAYTVSGAGSLAIACVLSSSPTFAQQISQTSVPPASTQSRKAHHPASLTLAGCTFVNRTPGLLLGERETL
jgi:hypothetical protein